MEKKIEKIMILVSVLVVTLIIVVVFKLSNRYSYEWVKVESSSIGQYRLYVNDIRGRHIDGTVRLVYINGKTKRVNVDKEGLLYVKSIVSEVRNPNKR